MAPVTDFYRGSLRDIQQSFSHPKGNWWGQESLDPPKSVEGPFITTPKLGDCDGVWQQPPAM